MTRLPLKDCEVEYHADFFKDHKTIKNTLLKTLIFETKEYEGRPTALYGDAGMVYQYAKNVSVVNPWTDLLLELKNQVEKSTGYTYNVCLANYYPNGKAKFGFHSDSEEIGNKIPIASISLGAKRKFYFKSKTTDEQHCVYLDSGSLLLMKDGTHENYVHALPPDNSIKSDRLNLTFRYVSPEKQALLPKISKTIVVNRYNTTAHDVHIGRPSKWGNPFKVAGDNRQEVINKYKEYLLGNSELMKDLPELKGKVLSCYCKPFACHGDILCELADLS